MDGRKAVLLDANLLLLLVIGTMDRDTVATLKRTQSFTLSDLDALLEMLANIGTTITTPHILTEVSNLANALREDQKRDFASAFRGVIQRLDERWTPAVTLAADSLFHFGIADIAAMAESRSALLVTEDGRFAAQVNRLGGYAVTLEAAIELQKQA